MSGSTVFSKPRVDRGADRQYAWRRRRAQRNHSRRVAFRDTRTVVGPFDGGWQDRQRLWRTRSGKASPDAVRASTRSHPPTHSSQACLGSRKGVGRSCPARSARRLRISGNRAAPVCHAVDLISPRQEPVPGRVSIFAKVATRTLQALADLLVEGAGGQGAVTQACDRSRESNIEGCSAVRRAPIYDRVQRNHSASPRPSAVAQFRAR